MTLVQGYYLLLISAILILLVGYVTRLSLIRVLSYIMFLAGAVLTYYLVWPDQEYKAIFTIIRGCTYGLVAASLVGLWAEWLSSYVAEKAHWIVVIPALLLLFKLWQHHAEQSSDFIQPTPSGTSTNQPAPPTEKPAIPMR